jgi:tetratricopeptide (TPR) repeat protein
MVSIGTVGMQQRAWSFPHRLLSKSFRTVVAVSSLSLALLSATVAHAQKAGDFNGTGSSQPLVPNNVVPLSPSATKGGLFSPEAPKQLLSEAQSAVSAQNYSLAASKLQDARQIGNQLSNFYQALAASFLGADSQASDSLRRKALDTAQVRDQATYQLALVYRAQSKPEQAIPLLIEIIRSQSPSRDLGQKSYQQLLELGFVDVPYPRAQSGPPKGSSPAPAVPPKPKQ